jgi:hypothetical protein
MPRDFVPLLLNVGPNWNIKNLSGKIIMYI